METRYTIGELATAADVPSSTIRYYERAGLLRPEGRTLGNYRYYTDESLERLLFIRAAQATGFTIGDVNSLLVLRDGLNPCQEVQELIDQRLVDITERMKALRHVQRVLRASLKLCHEAMASGRCQAIEEIQVTSRRASRKKSSKKNRTSP